MHLITMQYQRKAKYQMHQIQKIKLGHGLLRKISTSTNTYLKPELLQLVRKTNKTKVYYIDKIIKEYGHTSLRLPAYHAHINPIELVWARVKGQVAEQNRTFKMCDVDVLTRESLSRIDIQFWKKCVEHVLREKDEYWQRDELQFVQPVTIINLLESSDSE